MISKNDKLNTIFSLVLWVRILYHQVKVILKALEEAGIQIGEDEVFEKKFRPGINYDGKNRLGEGKRPDDVQIIQ